VAYLVVGCAALVAGVRHGGVAWAAAAWALAALAQCAVAFVALSRVGQWRAETRRTLARTAAALLLAPIAAWGVVRAVPALPDAGPMLQVLRLGAQGVAAVLATALVVFLCVGGLRGLPMPGRAATSRSS
jgi:hypothetical protein